MKYILSIIVLLIGIACVKQSKEKNEVGFNQSLANELSKMAEVDQLAARNAHPPVQYAELKQNDWMFL